MARNDKKSRIRGLPPKILLDRRDAVTGSYPSIARNAADNRTGKYNLQFNDQDVVVFQNTDDYVVSTGYNSGSFNPLPQALQNEYSTTTELKTTGNVQRGIVDEFIESQNPFQQELKPFHDEANLAADATTTREEFYLTGSRVQDIGPGFTNPLWSKTKIEIDLTPSQDHSFFIENYTSQSRNHPMAYWNKDLGVWEGIGEGKEWGVYYTASTDIDIHNFINDQTIGFGGSIGAVASFDDFVSASFSHAQPISNFGFPDHQKYAATSSNLIQMSDYISKPFLCEKMELYFSGALTAPSASTEFSYCCISTFFMLNQNNYAIKKFTNSMTIISESSTNNVVSAWVEPFNIEVSSSNSRRDLISWMQMSKIPPDGDLGPDDSSPNRSKQSVAIRKGLEREYNYFGLHENDSNYSTGLQFATQIQASGVLKSPMSYAKAAPVRLISNVSKSVAPFRLLHFIQNWNNPGRNQSFLFNHNYKNVFLVPEKFTDVGYQTDTPLEETRYTASINKTYSQVNPYILHPEDNLVLGFQLPFRYENGSANNTGLNCKGAGNLSKMDISKNGIHKIVLYGSEIQNDEEVHDTQNQLLTSNVVHETIEGDD